MARVLWDTYRFGSEPAPVKFHAQGKTCGAVLMRMEIDVEPGEINAA